MTPKNGRAQGSTGANRAMTAVALENQKRGKRGRQGISPTGAVTANTLEDRAAAAGKKKKRRDWYGAETQ